MRLQASINYFLSAPLSGQGAALIAKSIIGWPFVTDHQIELSWPLGTVMAEMPRLITSMCSVFHGRVAFPFLSSPIKKSLFCEGASVQGVQVKSGEKYFSVVAAVELLNVIWPDSTELISRIRGTI